MFGKIIGGCGEMQAKVIIIFILSNLSQLTIKNLALNFGL